MKAPRLVREPDARQFNCREVHNVTIADMESQKIQKFGMLFVTGQSARIRYCNTILILTAVCFHSRFFVFKTHQIVSFIFLSHFIHIFFRIFSRRKENGNDQNKRNMPVYTV